MDEEKLLDEKKSTKIEITQSSSSSSAINTSTMAAYSIDQPNNFDFQSPHEWPKWLRRFERFRIASGLNKKNETEQVNLLVYAMGDKSDDIFLSFNLSADEAKEYNVVVDKFTQFLVPKTNIIFERSRFNTRVQENGETVEEFITALYKLSENCGYEKFAGLRDEMIRDRLVVGLSDKRVNERLQLEDDLKLEKAIQVARQSENIKKQNLESAMGINNLKYSPQTKFSNSRFSKPKQSNSNSQSTLRTQVSTSCKWCGNKYHFKSQCPAKTSKCKTCSQQGHWASVCRNKNIREIAALDVEKFYVESIESKTLDSKWEKPIKVNNEEEIVFKIDTGADVTVIPSSLKTKLKLYKTSAKLYGPNRAELKVKGVVDATLAYKNNICKQKIFVVDDLHQPLLGRKAIQELQIIQIVNKVASNSKDVQPYTEFPKLWEGLGTVSHEYKITLDDQNTPYAITAPRNVPIALKKKIEDELIRMQQMNIISPIEEPTNWCSPMVYVLKPDGKVRICVDLTKLNKSVKREYYPISNVENSLARISGAKYFSKLDANSGFWQIPLDPSSRVLTTFITPMGRFVFNRVPFGITSAPEVFSRIMQKILYGNEGTVCHMDDILIFGSTKQEHNKNLRSVLKKLQDSGITLNKAKSLFCVEKVKFLGHNISANGISVDPERISAISKMAEPTNTKELLRFLGMVNFISRSIPNRSSICEPLNVLLKKDKTWIWDSPQQAAFDQIKRLITSAPVLAIFDPTKKIIISSDCSSYGMGACLFQTQENGENRPVAYISRTLTDAEKRYANIEREALAITWACTKLSDYIIGLQIYVETDHKPLVPIFNSKHIDELSPRLQRFKVKMMRFNTHFYYTPGKQLVTADTLSRQPIEVTDKQAEEIFNDAEAYVDLVVSNLPITDAKLAEVVKEQQNDAKFPEIAKYVSSSWPNKETLSPTLQHYWNFKDDITLQNKLLMRNSQIIIPKSLQAEMLNRIHEGHFGISKCRARASTLLWWPGISTDISNMVKRCPNCVRELVNKKEPLLPHEFPSRPWQNLSIDLLKFKNKWYVTLIDNYSRFIELMELKSLSSSSIIEFLKSIFARHGIPEIVYSDNGPQFQKMFTSEFNGFANDYGFIHVTSSPKFPQSNGMAEAAVKIVKYRLKKGGDMCKAMLSYATTPLANGYSPAELLYSRKLRTTLPTVHKNLQPKIVPADKVSQRESGIKKKQQIYFNKRHGASDLSQLQINQPVWITDKKKFGNIVSKLPEPRSYVIQTDKGKLRRNRFHLIPMPESKGNIKATETLQEEKSTVVPVTTNTLTSRYGRILKKPSFFKI